MKNKIWGHVEDDLPLFDNMRTDLQKPSPEFDGAVYDPQHDKARLTGQILKIFDLMSDGRWRTLHEIEQSIGVPAASASAQLRHLRKPRFGSHTVDKRSRGDRATGLWEYQLTPNERSTEAV